VSGLNIEWALRELDTFLNQTVLSVVEELVA
jgi:hypothetical protein